MKKLMLAAGLGLCMAFCQMTFVQAASIPNSNGPKIVVDRDPGYFHGKINSSNDFYYEQRLNRNMDFDEYTFIRDVSYVPRNGKIILLGSLLSSYGNNIMNFRTSNNDLVRVNLNGARVPMGQRIYLYGTILRNGIIVADYIRSTS